MTVSVQTFALKVERRGLMDVICGPTWGLVRGQPLVFVWCAQFRSSEVTDSTIQVRFVLTDPNGGEVFSVQRKDLRLGAVNAAGHMHVMVSTPVPILSGALTGPYEMVVAVNGVAGDPVSLDVI
jgi:hypothetical protein